jgi:hypothetical protein
MSTAHLVNAPTRRRVQAAVEQLSYRTDAIAQSLRTRRSLTIGFLIPDITNPSHGCSWGWLDAVDHLPRPTRPNVAAVHGSR